MYQIKVVRSEHFRKWNSITVITFIPLSIFLALYLLVRRVKTRKHTHTHTYKLYDLIIIKKENKTRTTKRNGKTRPVFQRRCCLPHGHQSMKGCPSASSTSCSGVPPAPAHRRISTTGPRWCSHSERRLSIMAVAVRTVFCFLYFIYFYINYRVPSKKVLPYFAWKRRANGWYCF